MTTFKNLMFKNSPTLTNSWEDWISLCAAITGKEKPHIALSTFHMNLLVLKIPKTHQWSSCNQLSHILPNKKITERRLNLFYVNNQKGYFQRATKQFRAVNNTEKKPHYSLFYLMHAFTGETYLTSQTSFSVFVVLNKTADRSVYGLNSLRKCCCLVTLNVYLPHLIPIQMSYGWK